MVYVSRARLMNLSADATSVERGGPNLSYMVFVSYVELSNCGMFVKDAIEGSRSLEIIAFNVIIIIYGVLALLVIGMNNLNYSFYSYFIIVIFLALIIIEDTIKLVDIAFPAISKIWIALNVKSKLNFNHALLAVSISTFLLVISVKLVNLRYKKSVSLVILEGI